MISVELLSKDWIGAKCISVLKLLLLPLPLLLLESIELLLFIGEFERKVVLDLEELEGSLRFVSESIVLIEGWVAGKFGDVGEERSSKSWVQAEVVKIDIGW